MREKTVKYSSMLLNAQVSPGVLAKSERELREAFLEEVERIPGAERLHRCIQCGTCTGSCPVSYTMDISPRQVIALFRAGAIEQILRSRTIWVCASCYNCTVRCPSQIKITDLLYALKRLAMDRGIFPSKFPVYVLSETFAKMIKRYGRNHELGLIRSFYLRTQPLQLLRQSMVGLDLLKAGRMPLRPEKIRGQKELKAIIARAEQIERPQELTGEKRGTDEVGYKAI